MYLNQCVEHKKVNRGILLQISNHSCGIVAVIDIVMLLVNFKLIWLSIMIIITTMKR